jgi:ubiquinone/menaquinone biosynthesis C-methylase UbiE
MKTDDIQKFNRWSSTYEDSLLQQLYFDHVHEGVLRVINLTVRSAPGYVVDVGCGTGRLLRKIRKRYPASQLMGIDPAEGMIEKARHLMPDAIFSVGVAESLPLPNESVDLVVSTLSFHHWGDQIQGMREIKRVLRPAGQFLLADALHPIFLAKIFHHGHVRTAEEITVIFEQAGLEVQMQQHQLLGHILVTTGIKRPPDGKSSKSGPGKRNSKLPEL